MIDITIKGPITLMHDEKLVWLKYNGNYEHEELPGILLQERAGKTYIHPVSEKQNIGPTDYYIINQHKKDEFRIYDWMIKSVKQHISTLEDVDKIIKGI